MFPFKTEVNVKIDMYFYFIVFCIKFTKVSFYIFQKI